MSDEFDVVVAGGGAVGLAIARKLAMDGKSVLLVEKGADTGLETSSRNSEVIHAGIYNPPGRLKSRLCVEGRALLYAFCAASGVDARAIGKLIVATTDQEAERLETLRQRGLANGVDDLQWIDSAQATKLEPHLVCTAALLSPSTGIVDSRAYMLALRASAEEHGCIAAVQTELTGVSKTANGFTLEMATESDGAFPIECRTLVNSAGHGAHRIANMLLGPDSPHVPKQYFAKGSYCSVSGRSPFSRLIYPVPVPGALGIHATVDMGGQLRLGPDIQWVEGLDYSVADTISATFADACARFWPGVRDRELTPSYCGVRPKIHGPHEPFADFMLQGPETHGIDGLVQLFGIESPGLTSSLAIANEVADLLKQV